MKNSSAFLAGVVSLMSILDCSSETTNGVAATPPSVACLEGFADCDGNPENGCEGALKTSVRHCGACGAACTSGPHGTPTCSAGRCLTACERGFGDCDGQPANGCESDLTNDSRHCGRCNKSCVCQFGICDLEVLANDLASPTLVVDDEDHIVWINRGTEALDFIDGKVMRLDKTTDASVTLAENERRPSGLLINGTNVYWSLYGREGSSDGAIRRAPKDGSGPVVTVVAGLRTLGDLATDGAHLYWTSFGSGRFTADGVVQRRALTAADPPTEDIASGQALPFGVVVDDRHVYWATFGLDTNAGSVRRLAKDVPLGTLPEELANSLEPSHLARDATAVYFGQSGAIWKIPLGSSRIERWISADVRPWRLTLTQDRVYWTSLSAGGPIESALKSDATLEMRSTGPHTPYDLLVDGSHVYWTSLSAGPGENGALFRMPRP